MGAAVGGAPFGLVMGAIAGEIGTGPASAGAAAAGGVLAVSLTAFGVFVARHAQLIEGFSAVMQRLLFPVLFVSGALFPLRGLPGRLPRCWRQSHWPPPAS